MNGSVSSANIILNNSNINNDSTQNVFSNLNKNAPPQNQETDQSVSTINNKFNNANKSNTIQSNNNTSQIKEKRIKTLKSVKTLKQSGLQDDFDSDRKLQRREKIVIK